MSEQPLPDYLTALEHLVAEEVLEKEAFQQFIQGNVAKSFLLPHAASIQALSKKYLQGGEVPLDSEQIKSYSLYYLPINFIKVAFLLSKLPETSIEERNQYSVLDFGAGPGSASLDTMAAMPWINSITLSDISKSAISFGQSLLEKWKVTCNSHASIHSSTSFQTTETYNLVLAANVLTEMTHTKRWETILMLYSKLKKGGSLILLEPALKATTRQLMSDRDRLLANIPGSTVAFPCPADFPCPMQEDDWCHGEIEDSFWKRPRLVRQLDELTGFNKHRIKYSAFIFQKDSVRTNNHIRMLRNSDGKRSALLCSPNGLINIHPKSTTNTDLRRLLKKGSSYQAIDSALLIKQ